jgi:tRNA G18 (ribose-2'-O)-methylase SpoU
MDLLVAAVESGADIKDVLVRRELVGQLPQGLIGAAQANSEPAIGIDVGVCDQDTLEYASSLGGGADVVFTCAQPVHSLSGLTLQSGTTFYLDKVGDPGNVGTIVRTSLAFGLLGVICSPGTADPFSPKAMRAGMGAQFLLPVVTEVGSADLNARLAVVREGDSSVIEVWVADPYEGTAVRDVPLRPGRIVVLGSERTGPSTGWQGARKVTIPQRKGDSLNVAMAATVLAYESSVAGWGAQAGRGEQGSN